MKLVTLLALFLAASIAHVAADTNSTRATCKADALAQHNFLRANHQAPALVWNQTLADEAQTLASTTAAQKCSFAPFTWDSLSVALPGPDDYISPCATAILAWYQHGLYWTFSSTPVADSATAFSIHKDLYTFPSLVWANTTQLGCGLAQAVFGCWVVVCRYNTAVPAPITSPEVEAAYVKNVKPPQAPANLTDKDACNSEILRITNTHRSEFQVPAMTWDALTAISAQSWANVLANQGCPSHTSRAAEEQVQVWLSAPPDMCAVFARGNYRQAAMYKFTNTPVTDNLTPADTVEVGAFVDMVYKNNTKIGCGRSHGSDGCGALVCMNGAEQLWSDATWVQNVGLPAAITTKDQTQCQQAALARFDAYRVTHGVAALQWNSSFATLAKGLAEDAANDTCDISWLGTDNGVDGYSIATSDAADVCGQAVDFFYSTGNATFKFTTTPWTSNQASFKKWHAFTQLIWKGTTQVGCGSAQGPSGCWVVICKYDPVGNVPKDETFAQDVFPARVLPPSFTPPGDSGINSSVSNSSNSISSGSGGGDSSSSSSSSSSGGGTHTTAIVVGACVAAGGVVAVVAGFLFWRRRMQQKPKGQAQGFTWGKVEKATSPVMAPLASSSDTTTGTGHTTSSGRTASNQLPALFSSELMSGAGQTLDIRGLLKGDPFTRGTAIAYSWNNCYARLLGVTQPVEHGVNDRQLDAMVQGSGGQVQECPVVSLSQNEVQQQLQLLTDGLRGRGGAALVFEALWPSRFGPDALLAVKVLKDGYDCNPYVLESFAHEASVLASVSHPNVVKLYGYCLDPPNVCLIMELLPYSLKDKLYSTRTAATHTSGQIIRGSSAGLTSHTHHTSTRTPGMSAPLTMSQVLQVSTEIAAGLAYLHDQPEQGLTSAGADAADGGTQKIVHRDLKPANILVNSRGQVKITDFGLARRHDSTTIETRHVGAGTVPYQAPEILSGSHAGMYGMKATNRCDVYSMALIFWELLSKQPPWRNMDEVNIARQVTSGKRPELPGSGKARSDEGSSLDLTQLPASLTALPAYNDIIRQCWAQRDWRRPTAAEAHRLLVELQQKYQTAATVQISIIDGSSKH